MNGTICKECNLILLSKPTPVECPLCHSSNISEGKNIIHEPGDRTNFNESEKKHIPDITVVRKCGLIEGCIDVHVKIGEIIHPMQAEHYIMTIDLYVDDEFIARTALRPDKIYPATAVHLKVSKGTLTAIEHCNIHGAWINKAEL